MLATTNNAASKKGEATCTSILGWIATGDCSIEAAAKDGKITRIATVDYKSTNMFGIMATMTTVVRGE
jgi:hypothetical protein